jgi:hypothetical protein
VKYYIRYADDFVIFSEDKELLEKQTIQIAKFLCEELKLELHPGKVSVETLSSGVDFLGMVNFSDHRILRTNTKRRALKKLQGKYVDLQRGLISEELFNQSLQSYLGMLKHCEGYKIKREIKKITPY